MPRLLELKDQTGATGRDITLFASGVTATDMIMEKYPEGVNLDNTKILINNIEVHPTLPPYNEMLRPLESRDIVTVVNEAKVVAPIVATWIQIASAVVAVAATVYAYANQPDIPGDVGTSKESPNNRHTAQTNIVRAGQSYPFIFGAPRCYPDLTGEAVVEYVNNVKIITYLMGLGYGLYDLTAPVLSGETLVTSLPGSSVIFYEPVTNETIIPTLTTSFATNEINGQELLGPNEGGDGNVYPLVLNAVGPTGIAGTIFTISADQDTNTDQLKTDFDASVLDFYLEVEYLDTNMPAPPTGRSGNGKVNSMVLVPDIGGDYYTIVIVEFTNIAQGTISNVTATEKTGLTIGPISMPEQAEQIWFDFNFLRGLRNTVDLKIEIQLLDGLNGSPVGLPTISSFSYTAYTLDQLYFTRKEILPVLGYYEFAIRRANNSLQSAGDPDQVKIESARAIRNYTNVNLGNMTCMKVAIPATEAATSRRENKVNMRPTSKLISWNAGVVNYTPQPSRKMADCLLHLWTNHFGQDPDRLALDELYEIQNRLDAIDPRLAQFDFTFDDIDVSLDERMNAILQVARCYKWDDGGTWRFVRDEKRTIEATTLTRNDITTENDRDYSISYNPQLLESFDSIKVEYIDPSNNKKAYIYRKLDLLGAVVDGKGDNPKSIELAGCQNDFNAINRAELELRKLLYQRWTLKDTFLSSAMLIDKGDMVFYAEQYNDEDTFDGEITAVNGDIATVSESLLFEPGLDYVVHYTLEDGSSIGPFAVDEVPGELFQFSCTSLSQAYVRDSILGFKVQLGSRFIIGTVENLDASRWTVIEKDPQSDKVNVSMVNYDDRVFEFDT